MNSSQEVDGEPNVLVDSLIDTDGKAADINSMSASPGEMLAPAEEETVDMSELQNTEVFPGSPQISETSESTSSAVHLVDDHVPTVILSEANQINPSVSLLHHPPVILTASALPALLAPVLGSSGMMDGIVDSERSTGLLITTKNAPDELLQAKTESLGGSCIVVSVNCPTSVFELSILVHLHRLLLQYVVKAFA